MFQEAAERFHEEAGISSGQDLSNMDDRIKIRDNIQVLVFKKHQLSILTIFKDASVSNLCHSQAGRIEEAISLVNHLHPSLLDEDR